MNIWWIQFSQISTYAFITPFQQTVHTFFFKIIKDNNNKRCLIQGPDFSYFTVIVVADGFSIYNVYNCNVLYKIEIFIKEKARSISLKEEKKKRKAVLFEIPVGQIGPMCFSRQTMVIDINDIKTPSNLHISLSHTIVICHWYWQLNSVSA